MAVRKIARMGNPVLRKKARPLSASEIQSPWFETLVKDMIDTMEDYGGIGLAAPQIHESVSVAIIAMGDDGKSVAPEVFVNPEITVLDPEEQGYWEGCLSVPDLRGLVFRPKQIRVDYLDASGRSRSIEASGFRATVFQHELDHLAGILYVDRIEDRTRFSFLEEYQKYWVPAPGDAVGELAD